MLFLTATGIVVQWLVYPIQRLITRGLWLQIAKKWVIRQVSTCELKHGRFTHLEVFFSNEIDEKNETNERITLKSFFSVNFAYFVSFVVKDPMMSK